jgi:hypothetical protein
MLQEIDAMCCSLIDFTIKICLNEISVEMANRQNKKASRLRNAYHAKN